MADFKLTDGKSPTVFSTDGYTLVVMPMLTADKPKAEVKTEAEPEPTKPEAEAEAEVAEAVAEAEAVVAEAQGERASSRSLKTERLTEKTIKAEAPLMTQGCFCLFWCPF